MVIAATPTVTDEENIVNTNIEKIVVPELEPESEVEIPEHTEHKDSYQTESINTSYQKVILIVVLSIIIIGIIIFIIKHK